MLKLKDLLADDERIVKFHLHNEYFSRDAFIREGSDDIHGALQETLHRILDENGTEEDVYRIMGAKIPTEDELEELEEFSEFIYIDLGYVLPGLIDMWEKI